jgi:hypothetical protein
MFALLVALERVAPNAHRSAFAAHSGHDIVIGV